MNFTGETYNFYSNVSIDDVFSKFSNELKRLGYSCEYFMDHNEELLIFYKNQEMLIDHFEYGYHLNIHGEGCFSISAKILNINNNARLSYSQNRIFIGEECVFISINNCSCFTLTLPETIELSFFCLKINSILVKVLKGEFMS